MAVLVVLVRAAAVNAMSIVPAAADVISDRRVYPCVNAFPRYHLLLAYILVSNGAEGPATQSAIVVGGGAVTLLCH